MIILREGNKCLLDENFEGERKKGKGEIEGVKNRKKGDKGEVRRG